jgi:L-threonylcarbamoyladenylate synthase
MKEVEKGNEEEEMGFVVKEGKLMKGEGRVLDVDLGEDVGRVAHALFGVLRELDRLGADVSYVEGVGDGDDIGAAVMNRLRKAASEIKV